MKMISFSVPSGTFPAQEGEHVRVSLKQINGLDMIDTLVITIQDGCGTADKITLEYDETMLPAGMKKLSRCNLEGFQVLCEWCPIRFCNEVFAPTSIVEEDTWHVSTIPTDFRIDQIKLYSPSPSSESIILQVKIDGDNLFSLPIDFDGEPLTLNRLAFAAQFADGEIDAGSEIELEITSAPEVMYYEEPWRGLTLCMSGQWLP